MAGKEEKVPPPLVLRDERCPTTIAMTAPEETSADPNPGLGREPMRRQRKAQGQHLDDYLFAEHFDRLQELPEQTSYFEALNYTVRAADEVGLLGPG